MKGELTPREININSISMFRAGVDTVRGMIWKSARYFLVRERQVVEDKKKNGPPLLHKGFYLALKFRHVLEAGQCEI